MKTIHIELSKAGIDSAIKKLEDIADNLEYDVTQIVHVLAEDGANVASEAYGSMASVKNEDVDESQSKIVVSGGDKAIIAEFGAGYATMEYHPFAKNAPVPIEVGSYSRAQYPYGLFHITNDLLPGEGYWIFGGRFYDRVQPRHGLLNAYDYILNNSTRIAKEVIRFD